MGYNYWVPILVLIGRWPRTNCASAVVQLDQLGVALYLSALGDYKYRIHQGYKGTHEFLQISHYNET